jgi:SOS response regulatory protein OraA/RecX
VRRPPKPLAPERAWDYALWLLGRQAYTSSELADRLRRRSLEPELRERVIARLQELGLLDDRAYAAAYVRRRRGERGRHALRAELLRKGVAESLVEAALAGDGDEPPLDDRQQLDAAVALLAKHAWRFKGSEAPPANATDTADAADAPGAAHAADAQRRARARAMGFLARRGFAPAVASEALARAWGEERDA